MIHTPVELVAGRLRARVRLVRVHLPAGRARHHQLLDQFAPRRGHDAREHAAELARKHSHARASPLPCGLTPAAHLSPARAPVAPHRLPPAAPDDADVAQGAHLHVGRLGPQPLRALCPQVHGARARSPLPPPTAPPPSPPRSLPPPPRSLGRAAASMMGRRALDASSPSAHARQLWHTPPHARAAPRAPCSPQAIYSDDRPLLKFLFVTAAITLAYLVREKGAFEEAGGDVGGFVAVCAVQSLSLGYLAFA